ncbi:MAG: uroporphyrinogen decarboxylase [Pedosphaera sp.]|nr:uroporphyrinogen decarboxylase [Pedosphaera sp.]
MTDRERFLAASRCQPVDRPPVWLMRQAGRCLPEYRELKEKYSFLQLIQNPDLATEVTLQPIKRFGFDGAVLFSDILVIPQALGQGFEFGDAGGIRMHFTLRDQADIERLQVDAVVERLEYVAQALRQLRQALGNRTALLGFAGSPWTLANFMMEGGSAKEFSRARALFYEDEALFNQLMEKLSIAVTRFLQLQIDAGADAVQIFDSLGGLLAPEAFEAASARWMRQIIESLDRSAPVIAFSKGTHGSWDVLSKLGAQVIGIDWGVRLASARKLIPTNIALQGNLDPVLLQTTPAAVTRVTQQILDDMHGHPGHIFNLGHGTPPGAKLDCIEALVNTVRNHRPNT